MEKIITLKNGFSRNQSNVSSLISNARTKMTALELKTFYQVTTLIQMNDTEFKEYEISVNDFARALRITDNNRDQIVGVCKRIIRQVFEIEQKNGSYMAYTIFSRLHYNHEKQIISMKFNEEFKPFLLNLKQFTKIHQVKNIMRFNSKYAIRIYALLKDYRKMAYRDFNLESLAKVLSLPDNYTSSYTRYYKYVIKPAIDEINANGDMIVKEPEIVEKKGKKISVIRIRYKNKERLKMPYFKAETRDEMLDLKVQRLNKIYKYMKYIYEDGDIATLLGFDLHSDKTIYGEIDFKVKPKKPFIFQTIQELEEFIATRQWTEESRKAIDKSLNE